MPNTCTVLAFPFLFPRYVDYFRIDVFMSSICMNLAVCFFKILSTIAISRWVPLGSFAVHCRAEAFAGTLLVLLVGGVKEAKGWNPRVFLLLHVHAFP